MFTQTQIDSLKAKLDPKHIKKRDGFDYVEAWHVIHEANRIFGFGEWWRETVYMSPVADPVTNQKGNIGVTYLAKVRITVRSEEGEVVREGTGLGHGWSKNIGDAHESAAKEAETDAMKRALMTFGNPFGLALYDKSQANVGKPELTEEQKRQKAETSFRSIEANIKAINKPDELEEYWNGEKIAKYVTSLMAFEEGESTMGDILTKEYLARKKELAPEEQNILSAG